MSIGMQNKQYMHGAKSECTLGTGIGKLV